MVGEIFSAVTNLVSAFGAASRQGLQFYNVPLSEAGILFLSSISKRIEERREQRRDERIAERPAKKKLTQRNQTAFRQVFQVFRGKQSQQQPQQQANQKRNLVLRNFLVRLTSFGQKVLSNLSFIASRMQ